MLLLLLLLHDVSNIKDAAQTAAILPQKGFWFMVLSLVGLWCCRFVKRLGRWDLAYIGEELWPPHRR